MKIKRLVIENFKSIERIELIEPNPFTVFVGPNGSGKSNIFEALEFVTYYTNIMAASRLFGGSENILHRKTNSKIFKFLVEANNYCSSLKIDYLNDELNQPLSELIHPSNFPLLGENKNFDPSDSFQFWSLFFKRISRIFVSNNNLEKVNYQDNSSISISASNLEKVLKRLLQINLVREEIFDWLELFIPGFSKVEIKSDALSSNDTLLFYDKNLEKPFTKDLISDGTYNILAILTAIYQSDEPQFLCIEEPENGLNPKVVRELVNLCRYACEEKGHFIWLNTHSQTLVSQLTPDEIILVDKKQGATETKQIKGMNLHGLPMDEAWLSKVLGGGLPW